MRNIEDLDKVEDIRSDWLVIETFHERCYFSTVVNKYENKLLSEVATEVGYKFLELRYCNTHNTHCKVDKTEPRALSKSEREYYNIEDTNIQRLSIDLVLILNLKEDWESEYVWGKTNMKFGLLDIKDN